MCVCVCVCVCVIGEGEPARNGLPSTFSNLCNNPPNLPSPPFCCRCEVYRSNFYTPFHGTSLIKPFVIGLEVDDGNRGDGGGGGGGGGLQDGEDELVAESVAVEAELDPVEIRFSYEDMRFMLSLALLYSEQFDKVGGQRGGGLEGCVFFVLFLFLFGLFFW